MIILPAPFNPLFLLFNWGLPRSTSLFLLFNWGLPRSTLCFFCLTGAKIYPPLEDPAIGAQLNSKTI
jgi:hypothetical protein